MCSQSFVVSGRSGVNRRRSRLLLQNEQTKFWANPRGHSGKESAAGRAGRGQTPFVRPRIRVRFVAVYLILTSPLFVLCKNSARCPPFPFGKTNVPSALHSPMSMYRRAIWREIFLFRCRIGRIVLTNRDEFHWTMVWQFNGE